MGGQVISAVNLTNGNKHSIGLPYGVCSTAKDTAAKTVTVNGGDGFVLEAGAMVIVKFTNANSIASPTLNVNGTGAKSICRYGTTKASTGTTTSGWMAGAVQTFVYDGTNWIREYWNNTTYSNASLGQGYATQDNSAQAAAITATLGSYSLTAGGIVAFKANYNVLANSTLNINGKGAKPIWFRGLAIANNIIRAGDVATLIYDGTNYHLLAIDRWQNDIADASNITSGTLSSDRLPTVPVSKGGTGTGFSLIDSADLKENPRVLLLKEDANGSRYFDAYTSLPVSLGGLGTRLIGNAQDNSLLVKQTDGNGEPFIDYTAHPKVESIAVGNCTINYDNDTNFLEFIFTSTTDTGTEV